MISITTQIEITTVGDGENHTDSWLVNNVNGAPPTQWNSTASSPTQTVPANAKGVAIVYPNVAGNRFVKGIGTDTGMFLRTSTNFPGQVFALLWFQSGNPPASIVLSSSVSSETWTLIWL